MVLPVTYSPSRPLLEGCFTFVLLLLFLGCMTDLAAGTAARANPGASMVGLVATVLLCVIGFQGVRTGSAAVVTAYWILTALLLASALAGIVKGVLSRAVPHVLGLLLGLATASMLRGKRFFV